MPADALQNTKFMARQSQPRYSEERAAKPLFIKKSPKYFLVAIEAVFKDL